MATASKEQDIPQTIKFDSIVVDVCFHPNNNVLAAGDIDGDIKLFSYSTTEENHEIMCLTHHKKACRCLCFSSDGSKLYTGSKDKSLCVVDMEKGALSQQIKKAHSCPLYCMHLANDQILATGDDEGHLKVWDLRQQKAIMDIKENDEFISDLALGENKRTLLVTSGDGTLSAFDIRKHKLKMQSELFDSEMLSLAIVKDGEKVVCGNGEGSLNIFNWGEWGNISDRFPGHPMSIDCMLAVTDSILFTGSFDGLVRAVNILPNRFLGVVGEHEGFPVENMTLSHCEKYLATCSHDQTVCFWNVEAIKDEKVDTSRKAKKTNRGQNLNKNMAKNDFFAGLEETKPAPKDKESDNDDDDDDANDDDDDDDVQDDSDSDDKSDNDISETESKTDTKISDSDSCSDESEEGS